MENKQLQFGEIKKIAPNCLLVIGRGTNPLHAASCATTLIYKFLDIVYVVDSGATPFFRKKLIEAIEQLKPYNSIVLINTHGHTDHISNNTIINDINAKEKLHFVSENTLEDLKNPKELITKEIENASEFIFMGKNPKQALVQIFEHLEPIDSSPETAKILLEKDKKKLYFGHISFNGWELADGHIKILESGGHIKESLMIYIKPLKLLFTGDETLSFFPIWPSSSAHNFLTTIQHIKHMLNDKLIDILIGSHNEQIFTTPAYAINFIDNLLDLHARFDSYIRKNLIGHEIDSGATINQLYLSLEASPFKEHLPKTEIYTKMLILNKIRSLGCTYNPNDILLDAKFKLPNGDIH